MYDVSNASLDVVGGGGCWHRDVGWEPCDSIGDALGIGVSSPYRVALVRAKGRSEIPTISAMRCPAASHSGLVMDDNADAWWGNWREIEVKWAM